MPNLLPERADILPIGVAPKHIRKWLQRAGGITPWGENRYRLVLAQCVMLNCGARWHDYVEGATLEDMGALEFSTETRKSNYVMRDPSDPTKSIVVEADVPQGVKVKQPAIQRVVEEMRWIPRLLGANNEVIEGWMLMVWYPPTYYSREHYEITVTGRPDLPVIGEFPAKGQYERQFFYLDQDGEKQETFRSMPGESWMQSAIEHHERKLADKANESPNVEWRMLQTLAAIKKAREAYEASQRSEHDAKIKDRISPIFSKSLAGGRYREQLAQRCREQGIELGHVGN